MGVWRWQPRSHLKDGKRGCGAPVGAFVVGGSGVEAVVGGGAAESDAVVSDGGVTDVGAAAAGVVARDAAVVGGLDEVE